jgi:hypothetical protein
VLAARAVSPARRRLPAARNFFDQGESGDPGHVSAGPAEAGDKSAFDRIGDGRENDWYVLGGPMCRQGGNHTAGRDKHRYLAVDHLLCECRQPSIIG